MLEIKSMDEEQIDKIKEIVGESNSFAIVLEENAEGHLLLARKALRVALQAKGKTVRQIPETPKEIKDKWSKILPDNENKTRNQSLVIHIPKDKTKIKELSYEDNDQFLTLHVVSENNAVSKDSIIFESQQSKFDAGFCFFENEGAFQKINECPDFHAKENIIFISANEKSVAEKTHDIIQAIDTDLLQENNISTLLFASLLLERIAPYRQSLEKTLDIEQELLRYGADKKFVNEAISESLSLDNLPVL